MCVVLRLAVTPLAPIRSVREPESAIRRRTLKPCAQLRHSENCRAGEHDAEWHDAHGDVLTFSLWSDFIDNCRGQRTLGLSSAMHLMHSVLVVRSGRG